MKCHQLDLVAGRFQKSSSLMLFTTPSQMLGIDALMRHVIMETKKNVVMVSRRCLMKAKFKGKISG